MKVRRLSDNYVIGGWAAGDLISAVFFWKPTDLAPVCYCHASHLIYKGHTQLSAVQSTKAMPMKMA